MLVLAGGGLSRVRVGWTYGGGVRVRVSVDGDEDVIVDIEMKMGGCR